jgi:hypothetical protein
LDHYFLWTIILLRFQILSSFAQVAASHLGWLRNFQQAQNRRGDIFERAARAEFDAEGGFVYQVKGDGVAGVCCVRLARREVNHLFGVAVVCGDEGETARPADAFGNPAEAGVNVLAGFYGLVEFARVAHHVRVGEVDDEDIRLALLDGAQNFVRDLEGGHLRL